MKTIKLIVFTGTMVLAMVTPALAVPIYGDLGMTAPPGTLGGYTLAAFSNDTSAEGSVLNLLAPPPSSPVSGSLSFAPEVVHYEVAGGWGTWGHGYVGDVYWLDEFFLGNSLTMTLPLDTKAFAFYLMPGFLDTYDFSILVDTSAGGILAPITASIDGNGGATGFGFYTNDSSDSLKTITITGNGTWPDGFAVGEFSINSTSNVPDGGITFLLLGVALFSMGTARRYFLR